MNMYGYVGKVLRINLTDGKISTEALKEDMLKNGHNKNDEGTLMDLYDALQR